MECLNIFCAINKEKPVLNDEDYCIVFELSWFDGLYGWFIFFREDWIDYVEDKVEDNEEHVCFDYNNSFLNLLFYCFFFRSCARKTCAIFFGFVVERKQSRDYVRFPPFYMYFIFGIYDFRIRNSSCNDILF